MKKIGMNALTLAFLASLLLSAPACKRKPAKEEQPAALQQQDQKKKAEEAGAPAAAGEFAESDEDLLTVDYKEFYDDLAPHGKWVEMSAKDLGFEPRKSVSAFRRETTLDRIFGIREACAQVSVGVEAEAVFVWQPSASLAVSAEASAAAAAEAAAAVEAQAEVEAEAYMPYENGEWTYTDAGWYFHAATPAEEITSHYGRWTFTAGLGWVWIPGAVWAPAWVDWREDDTYIAWTPVPPHVYLTGTLLVAPPVWDINHYVVVEKKYFLDPAIYKYRYNVKANPNKIMIKAMARHSGVMIKGKAIHNLGPDFAHVEKATGKKIGMVKINRVGQKGMVKYSSKEFNVYSPSFKKVKTSASVKGPVSKPKAFVSFNEARAAYKADLSVKAMGPGGIKGGIGIKEVEGIKGGKKGAAGAGLEAGYGLGAKGGAKGKAAAGGKASAGASFGFGASGGGKGSVGMSAGGKGSAGGKAAGGGKAAAGGKASAGKPSAGKGPGGGKGKGKGKK